jgi:hypothetical protein
MPENDKNRAIGANWFVAMADVERGENSLAQWTVDSVISLFAVRRSH